MTIRREFVSTIEVENEPDRQAGAPLPSETYVPKTMPAVLNSWGMTALFVICIYLSSGATTAVTGGPAAFTYLLLGGLTFFVPSLVATAQLGVLFPHEGALYNWTHKILGGYWSFFSGFCAWFPGVLITASFGDLIVTYIQAMKPGWLVEPWQQGIVICGILIFSGFASMQRLRTISTIITTLVVLLVVANVLIALSGVVWLLQGHKAATDFSHLSDWTVTPGNFVLFGLIVFAYIGTEGPLNLAGEMIGKRPIKQHLIWGGLIILAIYLTSTFSVLVVQGGAAAGNPYALITTVDMVLGKGMGSIVTLCLMASFIASAMVYNFVFARLLMVGSIDGRLPLAVGKLNKNRVPVNAIIFQTIVGIIVTVIGFMIIPAIPIFGTPANLAIEVYNVTQAAATLVWAISTLFLFLDLAGCFTRYRGALRGKLIAPIPVLWLCIIVGSISCIVGIVDTLWFSWLALIPNSTWWYIVGGLTIIFLIIAAVGSMIASSEAAWQRDEKTVGVIR